MKKRLVSILLPALMLILLAAALPVSAMAVESIYPFLSRPSYSSNARHKWHIGEFPSEYGYVRNGNDYYPLDKPDDFLYCFREDCVDGGSFDKKAYELVLTKDYTVDEMKLRATILTIHLNGHKLTVKGDIEIETSILQIDNGTISFPNSSSTNAFTVSGSYSNELRDVTFTNCRGTVFNCESDVTLTTYNVRFNECHSYNKNGSCFYINCDDAYFTFKSTAFVNCGNWTYDGGAIYIDDVKDDSNKILFENCIASGCKGDDGGFLYINDVGAKVYGNDNTVITGCSATRGGGIYFDKAARAEGFFLEDNAASKSGTDIYSASGSAYINHCFIVPKEANNKNSVVGGNQRGLTFATKETVDQMLDFANAKRNITLASQNAWDAFIYLVSTQYNNEKFPERKHGTDFAGVTVSLDTDVTCSYVVDWWADASDLLNHPSRPFRGTLDGRGHTITLNFSSFGSGSSGAFSLTNTSSNVGALSYTENAVIRNLTVKGTAMGAYSVGGVAGNANNTVLESCISEVNVLSSSGTAYTGGVVGHANNGTSFLNCVSRGAVVGEREVGGIAGHSEGSFTNCTNEGRVAGNKDRIGGITGWAKTGSTLLNCANYGNVEGKTGVGGLIGSEDGGVTARNCISMGTIKATNGGAIVGSKTNSSEYERCFYLDSCCPLSITGTKLSADAMYGRKADANVGKMPEIINDYVIENGKYTENWQQVYMAPSSGRPTFGISYLNQSGKITPVSAASVHTIFSDTTELKNGTYIVYGDTTVDSRMSVSGSVLLVLEDGAHLTVNGGIKLEEGNTLTVATRSFGSNMGKLTAIANKPGFSGIGGDPGQHYRHDVFGHNCGKLTVLGGDIYAEGCSDANNDTCGAGIGGGSQFPGGKSGGCGGEVSVYNGNVFALAHGYAAGIGGASGGCFSRDDFFSNCNAGRLNVYGGTITAQSDIGAIGPGQFVSFHPPHTYVTHYGNAMEYHFGGSDYFFRAGDTADKLGAGVSVNKDDFHSDRKALQISTHTAHSYETEYVWNKDLTECTAREVCSLCPDNYSGHIGKTETAVKIAPKVTEESCTQDGIKTSTAKFNDFPETTKTIVTSYTPGHDFVYDLRYDEAGGSYVLTEKCSRCGQEKTYTQKLNADALKDILEVSDKTFIHTGFRPDGNTHVAMDVIVNGSTEYWFGVWDESYNKKAFALGNDGSGMYSGYMDQGGTDNAGAVANGTKTTVELNRGTVYVGGVKQDSCSRTYDPTGQLQRTLYLFAQNRAGSVFIPAGQKITCLGCRIYKDFELVQYLLPCVQNGKSGLYDMVGGKFYGNAGNSGTMTARDEKAEVVPAKAATCTEGGYAEHYLYLGRLYADKDCTQLISDIRTWDKYEPALGHDCSYEQSYDPATGVYTVTEKCSVCDHSKTYTHTFAPGEMKDALDVEGMAYIDTLFHPDGNTRVVMDVKVNGRTEYWFGVWDDDYNRAAFALCNDNGGVYAGYMNRGGTDKNGAVANGTVTTVEQDKGTVLIGGVKRDSCSYAPDPKGKELKNTLYLFAENQQGYAFIPDGQKNTCYGCQIYKNNALARYYIPCVQNGISGLFDLVEGKFFRNEYDSGTMTAYNENVETVAAQAATCTEDGWAEHYKHGELLYADKDCTQLIPELTEWAKYEKAAGHVWKEDGAEQHKCEKCGTLEAHSFAEVGTECEICGYTVPAPTATPTPEPTAEPTATPTAAAPTAAPTEVPTQAPTQSPAEPTEAPAEPTAAPAAEPGDEPAEGGEALGSAVSGGSVWTIVAVGVILIGGGTYAVVKKRKK